MVLMVVKYVASHKWSEGDYCDRGDPFHFQTYLARALFIWRHGELLVRKINNIRRAICWHQKNYSKNFLTHRPSTAGLLYWKICRSLWFSDGWLKFLIVIHHALAELTKNKASILLGLASLKIGYYLRTRDNFSHCLAVNMGGALSA